jgi:hypothetical protein
MLSAIKDLREIAQCCSEGRPLQADLARWLGRSLAEFLAHRAQTIEEALGLRSPRGGIPWWREEAMRARNSLLHGLAQHFYAGESISAQARQIYVATMRYGCSAWRFDRDRDVLPTGYKGTPKEYLWRAFKSGAPMPIGERQLRTILAARRRISSPGVRQTGENGEKRTADAVEGEQPSVVGGTRLGGSLSRV